MAVVVEKCRGKEAYCIGMYIACENVSFINKKYKIIERLRNLVVLRNKLLPLFCQ